jgi:cobalt/nickel transport system ATP-binding protein
MALLKPPLIQLQRVSFRYIYQQVNVLNNINFNLYAGERVGLMGANGCGKSTLLRLLVGLHQINTGTLEILGKQPRTEQDFVAVRNALGFLFQDVDDQLFCPTVAQDIAFGPLNQGKSLCQAQEITQQVLQLLNLTEYEQRITYKLSGGEKRLIALATVLAMQPQVFLLDEPTSGLDNQFRQRILTVLQELPQAMLIASHDNDFLTQLTQRQVILVDGRLEPYGKEKV